MSFLRGNELSAETGAYKAGAAAQRPVRPPLVSRGLPEPQPPQHPTPSQHGISPHCSLCFYRVRLFFNFSNRFIVV